MRRFAPLALYLLLALWTTWPLARFPTTTVPLGAEPVATVPLFNVWTIWWNADRAAHGFRDYWDAPIFHPVPDTFAFSEPQPATILVAPVLWTTGSRVLAYNVYLWLSLVLNGLFAERLLRLLGFSRAIAIGGAAAIVLLPIVHWQRDVAQLVPLWGVLWTWTALLKLTRRPSPCRGAELGAAFAVTLWTSVHHALFLAVLLAGAVWPLLRFGRVLFRRRSAERIEIRSTLGAWLAAGFVAALLAAPIVLRMQHVARNDAFARRADVVAALSATPRDYTRAFGRTPIDWAVDRKPGFSEKPGFSNPRDKLLSPGWIKLALTAVGILFGLTSRRWRRWAAFLVLTAALAFLLSLGLNLNIAGWRPWSTLSEYVPGFAQVRNVFRFAYFVQLTAVLLAALGMHALLVLNRRFLATSPRRDVVAGALALLGIAAVFEVRPTPPQLARVPDASANAGWINFVRDRTPGRAIACLPFPADTSVREFESTTAWMYFATFHGVPLVNGYSGFFPPEYYETQSASNSFPGDRLLARFAAADVQFIVVDRSAFPPAAVNRDRSSFTLERVLSDPIGVDVYHLQRRDPAPPD